MLYPLKFQPILKDKIWGGNKLKSIFNKAAESDKLGESWELSGYENDESVVTNGFLAGNNIVELIEIYMGELVGDKIFDEFGHSFPLLFKLIDANQDLSIQVHPNNEVAIERHNTLGKTEMWYVVDSDENGKLVIGFSKDCTKEEYLEALKNDQVENLLQSISVKKGDVFFIPAGLVHAIGKGVVIAEIQQCSDLTYRIYDYKRVDENGNERELHTEQSLDVINFKASINPLTSYQIVKNQIIPLISCEFFTTNMLKFDKAITRNYGSIDSFVVYMCLEGSFVLICNDEKMNVNKGDTILIPACINEIDLIPDNEAVVLEIYI